jgi:hypothetical protein
MKAAILSIACVAGLGLSATSAKAGSFDVVVKFPRWGYVYADPYYPSVYAPYYPPTVITPAPIVVGPRIVVPVGGYPRIPAYYPVVPRYPYGHRHHR